MLSLLSKIVSGLLVVIFGMSLFIPNPTVQAAGITPTVLPKSQSVSTTASIRLVFKPVSPITNGSTIRVDFPAGYLGGASLLGTDVSMTATNLINTVKSFSASGFTAKLTTTGNVTTTVTIVIGRTNKLTTPVAAGNYAFGITTSAGDSGANFQYVGQANSVKVKAFVPISLSFAIRNSSDTAGTNTCDMGVLKVTGTGSCSYRLKVGSNAARYAISVSTSGNFTNGSHDFANAAGIASTNVVAFSADSNNVGFVNVLPATLLTVTGQNNPAAIGDLTNTTLITHRAGISSKTQAGVYQQTVTYTVLPTF
jgi:hypothetical protein